MSSKIDQIFNENQRKERGTKEKREKPEQRKEPRKKIQHRNNFILRLLLTFL